MFSEHMVYAVFSSSGLSHFNQVVCTRPMSNLMAHLLARVTSTGFPRSIRKRPSDIPALHF